MATAKFNQLLANLSGRIGDLVLGQDDPPFAQIAQKLKTSERQSINQSHAFQNRMANTTVVIEAAACDRAGHCAKKSMSWQTST